MEYDNVEFLKKIFFSEKQSTLGFKNANYAHTDIIFDVFPEIWRQGIAWLVKTIW